jgi:predicted transcriptional regulator
MKTACELVSSLVLPILRAWIAEEATKIFGMKQKDVARQLGLSKAAITQYLKRKRADIGLGKRKFKGVESLIRQTARQMASGEVREMELMMQVCKICSHLRNSLVLCELHERVEPKLKGVRCAFCCEL